MMMILAALASVAAAPVQAGRAMGVSGNPDAKAHFVLAEQPANADPDAIVMLRVENGASHYEENVPIEIDVLFAKADLAKIKWCTYRTTTAEMMKSAKTCKPSLSIEAGRSYTIR
jgi:hypothetical protein